MGQAVSRSILGSFKTLSGRFFLLAITFVMLAEVTILLPSIARFRLEYLNARLERAQIASLAVLASDMDIDDALAKELIDTAGVQTVVLQRDSSRELVLSKPIIGEVTQTYDLRDPGPWELIVDALEVLLMPTSQGSIRAVGVPVMQAGMLIEITLDAGSMRTAMLGYAGRILALSAFISTLTALLLLLSVQRIIVAPMQRVIRSMQMYANAPEDARHIITPRANITEIRIAEDALKSLQTQIRALLGQKERMARLGFAVAKISHDLRNILTSAQLFTDRLEDSADPVVRKTAPKLVNSITRAVTLCEGALSFGKAQEPPPQFSNFNLRALCEEIAEDETMISENTGHGRSYSCTVDIPPDLVIRADREHIFRSLSNIVRNARQAIEAQGKEGEVILAATQDDLAWHISVTDTGPGLPQKAKDHLFEAFKGSVRKGGSGLGLAIADELIKGHGGTLRLGYSDKRGTRFDIYLPK